MTKRGLGRGLGALIPGAATQETEQTTEIAVDQLSPNRYQPRRVFDPEKLAELADSIRQYGVIQPIVVRKTMQGFELAAGERRWRASRQAGLKMIPVVIKDFSDAERMEIGLIENLQREDLNPMEAAHAYRRLMEEFGLTQEEVAHRIGKNRSTIANTVRMLNLHPMIQEHVSRGTLTMGQAKPLLAIEKPDAQLALAETVVEEGLSAREVEALVVRARSMKPKVRPGKQLTPADRSEYVRDAENRLKVALGALVRIRPGKVTSKIEIECTHEDLERLLELLEAPAQAAGTRRRVRTV